jgi:hypothetical protein
MRSDPQALESPEFYYEKLNRRLGRHLLQFYAGSAHVAGIVERRAEVVARTLGTLPAAVQTFGRGEEVAAKTCLVGLKAEFELFTAICCRIAFHEVVDALRAGRKPGVKRTFYDGKFAFDDMLGIVAQGRIDESVSLLQSLRVPKNGLDHMVGFLDSCGLKNVDQLSPSRQKSFHDRLNPEVATMDGRPLLAWSQVRMGFQVRHAVEHSHSKVAPGDLAKFSTSWQHSSWRRHFGPSGPGAWQKIVIDADDIIATAAAMSVAGRHIRRRLDEWRVAQQA